VIVFVRRSKSNSCGGAKERRHKVGLQILDFKALALVAPPHGHVDHAATRGTAAAVMPSRAVEFAVFVY